MSNSEMSFEEWLEKRKENAKELRIRFDTLFKTTPEDRTLNAKWMLKRLNLLYYELFSLYDALEWLYENEIQNRKPMWDYLDKWMKEKKKEEEEKKKYR